MNGALLFFVRALELRAISSEKTDDAFIEDPLAKDSGV